MALSNEKATPLLMLLLAGIVGYVAYTGTVINLVGLKGIAAGQQRVAAIRDTITSFEAATDSAKKELARGSVAAVPSGWRAIGPTSCCSGVWCRSGTRFPTCWTTFRPGARSGG